ncbi:MAG: hypothetical protein ACYCW6_25270 [Candidatus Xenobia bacterium]
MASTASGSYRKAKTFHSTARGVALLAVPFLGVGGYLIVNGIYTIHKWYVLNPRLDPTYQLGSYVGIGIGVLLLLSALAAILTSGNRSITVTPERLGCKAGNQVHEVAWKDLSVVYPPVHKKSGRHILVSDGQGWSYRIEELQFPDFSLILDLVKAATKKSGEIEI